MPGSITYTYYKKSKPSLSASRNQGAKMAQGDYLLFLDDDVVLETTYIEEIMKVFDNDEKEEIGGVSGIIVNRRKKPHFLKYWDRLFLHSRGRQGALLPWAFYTRIGTPETVIRTDWIAGGISCFRRQVFDEFQLYDFNEYGHRGGRHGLADIEFSMKINKKYTLMVTPHAKLYHYPDMLTQERSYRKGYKQAFNYAVLFQKYSRKTIINILAFSWAMIGLIVGNMGASLVVRTTKERKERLARAGGNAVGIISFVFHK
jgi:GT2 family glycosyltransferase